MRKVPALIIGQLENTETRERKREREREREQEREGTPKTEVNVFDRAAHNKALAFQSSQAPRESGYATKS